MPSLAAPGQGRAIALTVWTAIFIALPFPFVALRLWARWIKKMKLAFNDYAIIIALIASTAFNTNILYAAVKGGYGQHMLTLSLPEIDVYLKTSVVATLLWPTANTFVKFSVLHFYKSIFRNQSIEFAIYLTAGLTFCYWLATIFGAFFLCRPFEFNWNKLIVDGTCGDLIKYYLSTGIVNLLIDVIIVALPLPVLWKLQLDFSRKLSLTVIFSLGALICIISIVRCYAIAKLNLLDATYDVVLDNICTCLEPTLGVINACLPLLQPVASKVPGNTLISWLKSWTSTGSSARKFGSDESKSRSRGGKLDGFRRVSPDKYPLSDIESGSKTEILGTTREVY